MIPTNDYLTRAPVVGIGASAGGLEATTQVLRNLGPELPFAYVVLQHVSPTHKSLLPEILGRETRLTVRTMEHGGAPEAGVVYVVPPNSNAAIHEGRFVLVPAKPEVFPKPSINDFSFRWLRNSRKLPSASYCPAPDQTAPPACGP